jgi:hypothetical protein
MPLVSTPSQPSPAPSASVARRVAAVAMHNSAKLRMRPAVHPLPASEEGGRMAHHSRWHSANCTADPGVDNAPEQSPDDGRPTYGDDARRPSVKVAGASCRTSRAEIRSRLRRSS